MANFNLTQGADTLTGAAADDIFRAYANRTNPAQAKSTLNAGDIINGGGGFNTLVLEGDYQNDVDAPVNHLIRGAITNIQRLVLTGEFRPTNYSGQPIGLDAGAIGALREIWVQDAPQFGLTASFGGLAPTLLNVSAAMKIVYASDSLGAMALNYLGGVTAATLHVQGQSIAAAKIAGAQLQTLSIRFEGAAGQSGLMVLSNETAASNPNLTTLNVDTSGGVRGVVFNGSILPLLSAIFAATEGDASVSGPPGLAALTSVTVTGTGGAWVDLGANTANVTFTGSGGNDAVLVDPAQTNANDSFNGGGGSDIFALSFLNVAAGPATLTPGAAGYAAINAAANFETIGFIGDFQRTIVVDTASIANQGTFVVGQDASFANLQDGDTIGYQLLHFAALQTSELTLKHAVDAQGRMTGNGIVSVFGDDILEIAPLLSELLGPSGIDPAGGTALFTNASLYSRLNLSGDFDAFVSGAATWKDSANVSRGVTIDASALGGTLTVAGATALGDRLIGTANADRLNGGAGPDTLTGGRGNDTYVNPLGDTITELANQGTDTVESNVSFDLTALAHVERLFLTGTAAIDGTGNALANQFIGNDKANTINGRDGDDTINGGGGADTINGGSGADRLIGGLQRDKISPGTDGVRDTVVFASIGESTGFTRDVIAGLDLANEDRFDLPGTVSAIAAPRSGALSLATFNQNLASVFTPANLPANTAALFTPTSGDLVQPGMVYLIVDSNGIAGYQANQDWVFQLENHTGGLDTTDFI